MTFAATLWDAGAPHHMRAGGKLGVRPVATVLLRVAFSVSLLAAALYLAPGYLDWSRVLAVGPGTMGASLLLSVFLIGLLAWRWRLLVSMQAAGNAYVPALGSFLRVTWLALAVNQILPSVLGGDALRISMLARRGIPVMKVTGSVVVDRFYGLAALVLICLASAPLIDAGLGRPALLAAAGLGAVAMLLFFVGARLKYLGDVLGRLFSFRQALVLLPLAAAGHVANIAVFLLIARGLDVGLPTASAIGIMSAVLLASVLPFSIAGWGVREFALVQAFGGTGIDGDRLVLASITYGLLLLASQAAGFLLLVWRPRW